MLVKEAVVGNLYRPKSNAIWSSKRRDMLPDQCPNDVQYVKLWKGHLTKSQKIINEHPTLLYLGSTREKWKIGDVSKHHWFLVDGKRVILNGNSFDLLESLDGKSL